MHIIKNSLTWILLLFCNNLITSAQEYRNVNKPKNLTELQKSIEHVLKETNTAGLGIVMLNKDSTIWIGGLGKADIENNKDVTKETMFRLGSISKMYVALAILKLQEEGKLNLKDKIIDLIPEIEFDNPWANVYPLRVEHLLEHTSGWSYWSFAELGDNDPKSKTLKEALDFYSPSRVCKFVPGTRFCYSNVGTSVAAYIVEKISGLSFEEYIDKFFFEPMGMKNSTFLYTNEYKKNAAVLYDNGIILPYLHWLYRPSGALNSCPKDMVNMLNFFINKGKVGDKQIVSEASLQRMERTESISISNSDMFQQYGLSNYRNYHKGFIYRGHTGSLPGAKSDFAYLTEYGKGYCIMVNGSNENVVSKIADLIKDFQIKELPQKNTETLGFKRNNIDLSGYYTVTNAKLEIFNALDRIKFVQKIWYEGDTLVKKYMLKQHSSKYLPVGNNEFAAVATNQIELIEINDPIVGTVLHNGGLVLEKISPIKAYFLMSLLLVFFITPISSAFFALVQLLVYFFGRQKNKKALWIALNPFISIFFILMLIPLINITMKTQYDVFSLLGTVNIVSIVIFVCSICFAVASVWSGYYILKNRKIKMFIIIYLHSIIVTMINMVLTFYFISHGLIGIQTWA